MEKHLLKFDTGFDYEKVRIDLPYPSVNHVEETNQLIYNKNPYVYDFDGEDDSDMDLPSGVIWATCNVGGVNPEDFGLFYQWGDTQGYKGACSEAESTPDNLETHFFGWSRYKYANGTANSMTKYNTSATYGSVVDNISVLLPEDDPVCIATNGEYRMPTYAEVKEIYEYANTTSRWTTHNDVPGRLFTSKSNGQQVFFPAAGFAMDANVGNVGTMGYYWSAEMFTAMSNMARYLVFNQSTVSWTYYYKCFGHTIRGVKVVK